MARSPARSRADPLLDMVQDAPDPVFWEACDDDPDAFAAALPPPRKGRGAVSNRAGRFEPTVTDRVDDG